MNGVEKNWGTKWGIYNSSIQNEKYFKTKGKVKYNFRSAWSPATKIIHAMSLKFPQLTFELKYYERGMEYKGVYKVINGNVLIAKEEKYKGKRGG